MRYLLHGIRPHTKYRLHDDNTHSLILKSTKSHEAETGNTPNLPKTATPHEPSVCVPITERSSGLCTVSGRRQGNPRLPSDADRPVGANDAAIGKDEVYFLGGSCVRLT